MDEVTVSSSQLPGIQNISDMAASLGCGTAWACMDNSLYLCLVGATFMPCQTVVWEHLQSFASGVQEANNCMQLSETFQGHTTKHMQ